VYNYQERNEARGFFHGSLIKFGLGLLPGGGVISGGIDILTAQKEGGKNVKFALNPADRTKQERKHSAHGHLLLPSGLRTGKEHGDFPGPTFAPTTTGCTPPLRLDVDGQCRFPGSPADTSVGGGMVGTAVMGRYGAAYVPGSKIIDRAVCLRGDVVADDGLCYPKRSLRNSDRQWPRGRQPLLTGGEMRAISIARRAAGRFERTQKNLQKIGLIKKPSPRKALRPHQHAIAGGPLRVLSETTN